MIFHPVDVLPDKVRCKRKYRAEELMTFLAMNTRYAKVEWDSEYNSPDSIRATIVKLSQYHGLPIWAYLINGEVYVENLIFAKREEKSE